MVPSARSAATWVSGQCSHKGPRTRQSRRSLSLSRTNAPFFDPISTRTFMGGLPLLRPRRHLGNRARQDRAACVRPPLRPSEAALVILLNPNDGRFVNERWRGGSVARARTTAVSPVSPHSSASAVGAALPFGTEREQ